MLLAERCEYVLQAADAHILLAEIALATQAFECADHHSHRALELNPNDPHAAAYRAYVLAYLGRCGLSLLSLLDSALESGSRFPELIRARAQMGHDFLGSFDEAGSIHLFLRKAK